MDISFLKNHLIAVLMGGPGVERDVSLASGTSVAKALQEVGLSVVTCDVKDRDFTLPEGVTFAMNMIHGTFGEDGELQELLEKRGIPYSGAGVEGSRMAIDKIASKKRFVEFGIPTAPFEVLREGERPSLSVPFVIKAPKEGSTLGVYIIKENDSKQIEAALEGAFQFGEEILVEEFFSGKELTVGILGEQAFPIIEIRAKDGLYDYKNKYSVGGSQHVIPAPLDSALTARIQKIALDAHHALGLEVYSRVDMMLSDDGRIAVLEINTIPGMTETSLLPDAAAVFGLDFAALCVRIVELSLLRSSK
ncbi:MAG: D-alanine--D-alanine ligase [Chthoniobacterales bacterium]